MNNINEKLAKYFFLCFFCLLPFLNNAQKTFYKLVKTNVTDRNGVSNLEDLEWENQMIYIFGHDYRVNISRIEYNQDSSIRADYNIVDLKERRAFRGSGICDIKLQKDYFFRHGFNDEPKLTGEILEHENKIYNQYTLQTNYGAISYYALDEQFFPEDWINEHPLVFPSVITIENGKFKKINYKVEKISIDARILAPLKYVLSKYPRYPNLDNKDQIGRLEKNKADIIKYYCARGSYFLQLLNIQYSKRNDLQRSCISQYSKEGSFINSTMFGGEKIVNLVKYRYKPALSVYSKRDVMESFTRSLNDENIFKCRDGIIQEKYSYGDTLVYQYFTNDIERNDTIFLTTTNIYNQEKKQYYFVFDDEDRLIAVQDASQDVSRYFYHETPKFESEFLSDEIMDSLLFYCQHEYLRNYIEHKKPTNKREPCKEETETETENAKLFDFSLLDRKYLSSSADVNVAPQFLPMSIELIFEENETQIFKLYFKEKIFNFNNKHNCLVDKKLTELARNRKMMYNGFFYEYTSINKYLILKVNQENNTWVIKEFNSTL